MNDLLDKKKMFDNILICCQNCGSLEIIRSTNWKYQKIKCGTCKAETKKSRFRFITELRWNYGYVQVPDDINSEIMEVKNEV